MGSGSPSYLRTVRTGLRTAHLLAFGCLYGGAVYGASAEALAPALAATVCTGISLLALDALREPITWVQVRGIASLTKIGLVVGCAIAGPPQVWALTTAAIIGAVSSHMPGRYRYYSLVHRRIVGDEDKG